MPQTDSAMVVHLESMHLESMHHHGTVCLWHYPVHGGAWIQDAPPWCTTFKCRLLILTWKQIALDTPLLLHFFKYSLLDYVSPLFPPNPIKNPSLHTHSSLPLAHSIFFLFKCLLKECLKRKALIRGKTQSMTKSDVKLNCVPFQPFKAQEVSVLNYIK